MTHPELKKFTKEEQKLIKDRLEKVRLGKKNLMAGENQNLQEKTLFNQNQTSFHAPADFPLMKLTEYTKWKINNPRMYWAEELI